MSLTKEQQLQYIAHLVGECHKCELYKTATNHVPGAGNPEAEIVFIGEAPGFLKINRVCHLSVTLVNY